MGSNFIFFIGCCECWVFGLKLWIDFILLLNSLMWYGLVVFIGKMLISVLCMVKLLVLVICGM